MIKRIGVIGAGQMGSGIAHVCALKGFDVRMADVDQGRLDKSLDNIGRNMDRQIGRGMIRPEDKDAALRHITTATDFKLFADCDLVIEAATENLGLKKELLGAIDAICKPETIFASNTSSLSITEMSMFTKRPGQVIGLHFFNPVPLMKLVEVVKTVQTKSEAIQAANAWCMAIGKTVVSCGDSTGFVVNRLLVPYMLDAMRVFEQGLASRDDIDNAMKLGCGYPMGPLLLTDYVGLDTTYYISEIMFDEFKEPRFAAPPMLKRMVLAGLHGRKTGKGFYDWSTNPPS